jgi:hypothetical protein
MEIRIQFDTENDSFQDYPHGFGNWEEEVKHVLKQAADILTGDMSGDAKLRDSNGNTVGTIWWSTTNRRG